VTCRLCQRAGAEMVFSKKGRWSDRTFEIYRCAGCRFVFVGNPWLDYEQIYNDDYYAGRGADPLIGYIDEVSGTRQSVRLYEWRGIRDFITSVAGADSNTVWLDYGCGSGGLVRYLNRSGFSQTVGFEQPWALTRLRSLGIPSIDNDALDSCEEHFDVVTAIEVLEHVVDPLAELRRLRRVLKPGGLLFLTTGNPRPFSDRLDKWSYIVPEVHISFFEPDTLAWALREAGFEATFPGYRSGWTDIVRFKTLKNLRRRRVSLVEALVPWSVVGRVIDRRFRLSAQPVGWAI
jgi:SAM-dependent methyltransferase